MLSIRKATSRDCDVVLTFINELENSNFNRKTFEKLYLKNIVSGDNIYLIACEYKEAVGFLSCHIQNVLHHNSRVAEIQEMFVLPDFRNKGIGKNLLRELQARLRKLKVRQLEVASNRRRLRTHQFYLTTNFKWTSKKFVLKY